MIERENAILVEKERDRVERKCQMTALRVEYEILVELSEMRHQLAMR